MWIHTTVSSMQAFWYYLAWALPSAIKAALLLKSSIPLNFGNPDSPCMQVNSLCGLAYGSFAQVKYCFRNVMDSSPLSFARKGFRVIMSTCGDYNLACLQHIFRIHLCNRSVHFGAHRSLGSRTPNAEQVDSLPLWSLTALLQQVASSPSTGGTITSLFRLMCNNKSSPSSKEWPGSSVLALSQAKMWVLQPGARAFWPHIFRELQFIS